MDSNDTFKLIPFLEQNDILCSSYFKFRYPNAANTVAMSEFRTRPL